MKEVFGNRLKSARLMAGFSLQDLADSMDNIITKQSLSKYEKNIMLPNGDLLIALANSLDVTVDYFFSTPKHSIELNDVEYRKRASFGKTNAEAIKSKTIDFLEKYFELEEILNINEPFQIELKNKKIRGVEDVEIAAEELRDFFNLGEAPILSVYELLEEHGCKIFEVDAPMKFDGMKADVDGTPIIVLNKNFDVERRRFSALHELAHYVLEIPESFSEKEEEYACHRFAAAVLFPKKRFIEEMSGHRLNFALSELILLKEYWGISIKAIIVRAKTLDIINDYVYRELMISYSSRGFNKNEPGRYEVSEKTIRFNQLLYRAVAENIISINKAATITNKKVGVFRRELDLMR